MPQLTFTLSTLATLDNGCLAEQFQQLLRRASEDCRARPMIVKKREINLRVYLEPVVNTKKTGPIECEGVAVAVELGAKVPGHKSTCYLMKPTGYGTLQFHPDFPGEPEARTLFDQESEQPPVTPEKKQEMIDSARKLRDDLKRREAETAANGQQEEPEPAAWPMPGGLTEKILLEAYIPQKVCAGKKLTKPATAKAFEWDGQLWVVISRADGPGTTWDLRPLIPVKEFEERLLQYQTKFQPSLPDKPTAEDRLQYFTGVIVKVDRKEYALAPAGDGRKVIEPPPASASTENGQAIPAGPPEGPVKDVDSISVADLDLPMTVWSKLDDEFGLSTVGDLRRLAEEKGKTLSDCLVEATGLPLIDCFAVDKAVVSLLDAAPRTLQRCRVCGCTEDDCSQCVEKTGVPCYWVEPDLCSACAEYSRPKGRKKRKKGKA